VLLNSIYNEEQIAFFLQNERYLFVLETLFVVIVDMVVGVVSEVTLGRDKN